MNEMKARPRIFALHGFAGQSSDWNSFQFGDCDLHAVDMQNTLREASGLRSWADLFLREIENQQNQAQTGAKDLLERKPFNILMGYSMGGRLALHAILADQRRQPHQKFFSAAIFVSTHLGGLSASERDERLIRDAGWAKRFMDDDLSHVWRDWSAQDVLRAGQARSPESQLQGVFSRDTSVMDRSILAKCLQEFSTGRQEDLRRLAAQFPIPCLWLAGEDDVKFQRLLVEQEKLAISASAQRPKAAAHEFRVVANAGHRLPWERPNEFTRSVQDFLLLCQP